MDRPATGTRDEREEETPAAGPPDATNATSAPRSVPIDTIFGVPGEQPILSRKTYKALVKAGVEEVEVDPTATAGDLQARYGICPRAAQELREALGRLSDEEEPVRQENE